LWGSTLTLAKVGESTARGMGWMSLASLQKGDSPGSHFFPCVASRSGKDLKEDYKESKKKEEGSYLTMLLKKKKYPLVRN